MDLRERLTKTRPLLMDGAMGTELEKYNPQSSDYPNEHMGFNDGLCITHPEWIKAVHETYINAGAECITTNTFGSSRIKLAEYDLADKTQTLNENAVLLTRDVIDNFTDSSDKRYILGSMGPSGYAPSLPDSAQANVFTLTELEKSFIEQALGLLKGGVDGILLETGQDTLELKSMINAIRQCSKDIPIIACITFAQSNRMLGGSPVQSAYYTLAGMNIDVFGINCSTGPVEMTDSITWLNENSTLPLCIYPNAGLPDMSLDSRGQYSLNACTLADMMQTILTKYTKIKLVGGCCGTTPEYIKNMRDKIDTIK